MRMPFWQLKKQNIPDEETLTYDATTDRIKVKNGGITEEKLAFGRFKIYIIDNTEVSSTAGDTTFKTYTSQIPANTFKSKCIIMVWGFININNYNSYGNLYINVNGVTKVRKYDQVGQGSDGNFPHRNMVSIAYGFDNTEVDMTSDITIEIKGGSKNTNGNTTNSTVGVYLVVIIGE